MMVIVGSLYWEFKQFFLVSIPSWYRPGLHISWFDGPSLTWLVWNLNEYSIYQPLGWSVFSDGGLQIVNYYPTHILCGRSWTFRIIQLGRLLLFPFKYIVCHISWWSPRRWMIPVWFLGPSIWYCWKLYVFLSLYFYSVNFSIQDLNFSLTKEQESWLIGIMLSVTLVKLVLVVYCRSFSNEIVKAYAQDHFFDVVTNVIGLIAALLAHYMHDWIDPVGAIIVRSHISLYSCSKKIIWSLGWWYAKHICSSLDKHDVLILVLQSIDPVPHSG